MNRLLLLTASDSETSRNKSTVYEWTAFKYPLQNEYVYKNYIPNKLLWVEDKVYNPDDPTSLYRPALILGNSNPEVLDADTPHRTRLQLIHTEIDDSPNIVSNGSGITLMDEPFISTPTEEELRISLETELMILLPMEETDLESRAVLIGWRPSSGTSERVELLMVRNEEGLTKLELVVQGEHEPETVVDLEYSPGELLLDRNVFDLHISKGVIEVYVNGEKMHVGRLPEFNVGGGYMYMFSQYRDYQSFNIARPLAVRIERVKQ